MLTSGGTSGDTVEVCATGRVVPDNHGEVLRTPSRVDDSEGVRSLFEVEP